MEGAHEHMEHAEHAGHAHDPFDKRVAVSIAIVAAVLAGVSMLGHRKHNEVLQLTTEANIHTLRPRIPGASTRPSTSATTATTSPAVS